MQLAGDTSSFLHAMRNTLDGAEGESATAALLGLLKDAALTANVEGNVLYLNPAAEALTGWRACDVRNAAASQVLRLTNGITAAPMPNPIIQALRQKRPVMLRSEAALVRRSGEIVPVDGHAAPMLVHGRVNGAIAVFRDASEAREIARPVDQDNYDSLTGLVTRSEFERRAEHAVLTARSQGVQHALCVIDLDQFNLINETCGRDAGDKLLHRLADVLRASVRHRESDTLARLGGDEFGLLLEACPLEHARKIAHDVLAAINGFRFDWLSGVLRIGASIGVTTISASCRDVPSALAAADSACFAAKEKGRNRVHAYKSDDLELSARKVDVRWVNVVGDALSHDRFALFFQPFLPVRSKAKAGGEILVRMIGSGNQLIPPSRFLTAAERYNLMPLVDRWVIRNTFAAYRKLQADALWSINVSPATLNSQGVVEFVREQATRYRIPPQSICFEIAEAAAAANAMPAVDFIWGLKTDGFRFALDDFGIGMSSFTWLKTLPIDYLKIDGKFVKQMLSDRVSMSVVQAICHIASAVGLETIAECVEDRETLQKLEALGVNYAQGYVAGHPAALDVKPRSDRTQGVLAGLFSAA